MNFKFLKEVSKDYNLFQFINTSLRISAFDKEFSCFYIVKRNIFERLASKESKLKYKVFKNEDYSMRGAISYVKYFKDKDSAAEYVWQLFKNYINDLVENPDSSKNLIEIKNSLLKVICSVEEKGL